MSLWSDIKSSERGPRSGIAGSHSNSISGVLRNRQTDFQRGCMSLHAPRLWINAPPSLFPHQHFLLLVFWLGEIRILKWVSSVVRWWLRMPNTFCSLAICIFFLEDCLSNFIICLSSSMCGFVSSRYRSCQMFSRQRFFSHSAGGSSLAWQFPFWYRSFFSFTRSRLSIALSSALLGSTSESSYLYLSGDVYSLLVFLEVSNFQVWRWCPWCICSCVLSRASVKPVPSLSASSHPG